MKIKWLGHSCFLMTSDSGIRVLTDPFNASVGYPVPEVEADIVTSSHPHYDHSYFDAVKGSFTRIDQLGNYLDNGIKIVGVPTYHDDSKGTKRGLNIIFKYEIDGIKICHCGDLGHVLTPEQCQAIGEVDILLVPVGGFYTIDPVQARKVVVQLNPEIVIPMHFKTPVMDFPIVGVDKFLEAMGEEEYMNRQEIEIKKETLKDMPNIVVLDFM